MSDKKYCTRSRFNIAISLILPVFLAISTLVIAANIHNRTSIFSKAKGKPGNPVNVYTSMAVTNESYAGRNYFRTGCVGVDDSINWNAAGSLTPGESFTFTPSKPICTGEFPVVTAYLTWDNSDLQLSTIVPFSDFISRDQSQIGKEITAPNLNKTAQLCMFAHNPTTVGEPGPGTYTYHITVKNIGSATAYNVRLEGTHTNGWISNFYYRCLNADADHDLWNDSLEFGMADMVYSSSGAADRYTNLFGSNYFRTTGTDTPNDEMDFYPPDFNDDNRVDQADINIMTPYLGQGTGVSLADISPNGADPNWYAKQAFIWRRYDLNSDGYIDQTDLNIVKLLLGKSIPLSEDIIYPTVKITHPSAKTVSPGASVLIGAYAWDNASIAKVEFYINDSLVCTDSQADMTFANVGLEWNPLYSCWWSVSNKRAVSYKLQAKVYDGAGNVTASSPVNISAQ